MCANLSHKGDEKPLVGPYFASSALHFTHVSAKYNIQTVYVGLPSCELTERCYTFNRDVNRLLEQGWRRYKHCHEFI